MLTGDLLGMSTTTDNVGRRPTPNAWWRNRRLTIAGVGMGCANWSIASPSWPSPDSAWSGHRSVADSAFLAIVFGNQATDLYEPDRRRMWSPVPAVGSSGRP